MGDAPPSERVYVSCLPAGIDDEKLKSVFGAYGTLKEVKNLGSSKACILTFASLDEAKWIVENLDGNMPEGITEPVTVKFAYSSSWGKGGQTGGCGGGGGGGGFGANRSSPYGGGAAGGKAGGKGGSIQLLKASLKGLLPGGKGGARPDACQLYVRGLPSDTSDADLLEIFAPFGAIPPRGVKAMLNPQGECTGIGWVDYMEESCAVAAVAALNGTMLVDGSSLRIHVKNSSKKWNDGKGGSE